MPQPNLYSDEYLIEHLQEVAQSVDGYLGASMYRNIKKDEWPSGRTYYARFGSWKEAKIAAGLPARDKTYAEDKLTGKAYYEYLKDQQECQRCGEDYNTALAFHHPEGVSNEYDDIAALAPDDIYQEANKCICLCFSCHQKHHDGQHPLDADESCETMDPPEVSDVKSKLV